MINLLYWLQGFETVKQKYMEMFYRPAVNVLLPPNLCGHLQNSAIDIDFMF